MSYHASALQTMLFIQGSLSFLAIGSVNHCTMKLHEADRKPSTCPSVVPKVPADQTGSWRKPAIVSEISSYKTKTESLIRNEGISRADYCKNKPNDFLVYDMLKDH